VLGICYGAQLTAKLCGGRVEKSEKREYGRAFMVKTQADPLLNNLTARSQVWMSHGDSILELPEGFEVLATTDSIPVAAFKKVDSEHPDSPDSYRDRDHHQGIGHKRT
jgi:GMP synthase (glutamine-hydrolysing)